MNSFNNVGEPLQNGGVMMYKFMTFAGLDKTRRVMDIEVSPLGGLVRGLRNRLFYSIFIAAGLSTFGITHAQQVTYQENLGNGDLLSFTLQNYTLGSALSNSNFVSFSDSYGSFSISSSDFSSALIAGISGSLSSANLVSDNFEVYIGRYSEIYGTTTVVFDQQGDTLTVNHVCYIHEVMTECTTPAPNGKGVQTQIVYHPTGVLVQPVSAPEIDLNSASGGLTVLVGGILVLQGRLRRTLRSIVH